MDAWVDRELGDDKFPDQRLRARLGKILGDLGRRVGGTIPTACQDWAATKAADRFFSNPRVDEGTILAGHFAATKARCGATAGPVLVLHDTTEFSFQRINPEAVGVNPILQGLAAFPGRNVLFLGDAHEDASREAMRSGQIRSIPSPPSKGCPGAAADPSHRPAWRTLARYLVGDPSPGPTRGRAVAAKLTGWLATLTGMVDLERTQQEDDRLDGKLGKRGRDRAVVTDAKSP